MTNGTVFASLRRANRVWAVASIHGEADRLNRLHADLARRISPDDLEAYVKYLGQRLAANSAAVLVAALGPNWRS